MDHISGIGPKRRQALRSHFGSLPKMREATIEELTAAPGMNRKAAEAVWGFFQDPHNAGLGKKADNES